jgi:hypothetical protein
VFEGAAVHCGGSMGGGGIKTNNKSSLLPHCSSSRGRGWLSQCEWGCCGGSAEASESGVATVEGVRGDVNEEIE